VQCQCGVLGLRFQPIAAIKGAVVVDTTSSWNALPKMPVPSDHSLNPRELIDHARRSERIARTLFDIEVEVMNLSDSATFLDHLTELVRTRFALDWVWLVLTDIESNQPLCAVLSEQELKARVRQVSTVDFMRHLGSARHPLLTNQPRRFGQLILPEISRAVSSMAILPLIMDDRVIGGLFLGSRDAARYHPDMEAFFLQQLSVKASIGLTSVWAREQLRRLATRDPLTGLRNRRDLDHLMGQELSRSRRYGASLSVLFIDCDDFKQVNDTHGHDCGDAYLCFVASHLQLLLREDDSVFRFAGDEFVVLLPNQDLASAKLAGQRFAEHFRAVSFDWCGQPLQVSFSWGAASSGEPGLEAAKMLMRAADQRLYQQKRLRKSVG